MSPTPISGLKTLDNVRVVLYINNREFHVPASALLQFAVPADEVVIGTYTPTLTGVDNIAGSTSSLCRYIRIGGRVIVSGLISVDPTTASGTNSRIDISLPITTTLAATESLAGVGASRDNGAGQISADTINNRAQMIFKANEANAVNWSFQFEYDV